MKLWLDAQLSPEIAEWINQHFAVDAIAIRDVGLRDASDFEIFTSAKQAGVVVITKDSDFSQLNPFPDAAKKQNIAISSLQLPQWILQLRVQGMEL